MASRFCVRPTSESWFLNIVQVTMNMIHSMPWRNPCRLCIYLAFTYFVGSSSIVWSKLGLTPPFPPMRVLEVYWSWALSLVCEVGMSSFIKKLTYSISSVEVALRYLKILFTLWGCVWKLATFSVRGPHRAAHPVGAELLCCWGCSSRADGTSSPQAN